MICLFNEYLLENANVFFDFNKSKDLAENILPDGMTIDKQGNLWVACFNGARVINICTKSGEFCIIQIHIFQELSEK